MNIAKRFLTVLTAIALVLSLAACGGGPASSTPESSKPAESTASSQASQETSSEAPAELPGLVDYVTPAGEFPISKETVELRFMIPQSPYVEDYAQQAFTKWLEEQGNVKLAFDVIPAADMAQKIQLSLASFTDLPDAYIGGGRIGSQIFSTTNIVRYGEEGQVIALNDMIDAYGENLKALWARNAEGTSLQQMMTSADGNIYYMPGFGPATINRYPNKYWINRNYLEALNLEVPTTTEELYNVLKAFKEKDPNGNNQADEIALVGTDEQYFYAAQNFILSSFVVNNPQNVRLVENGGKIEFVPVSNEWREAMKYLNRLCSEGLLSPLSFTQNLQNLKQIVNDPNDICGGFISLGVNLVAQGNDPEILSRYQAIGPVAGPDGTKYSTISIPTPMANGVITSTCQYPAVVFRLFDLMLSLEGSTFSRFGVKGEHWSDPEPGQLSKFDTPATINLIKNIWSTPQTAHWMNMNPYVNDVHADGEGKVSDDDYETINAKACKEYAPYEPTNTVPILIYNMDQVEEANEVKNNIEEYMKESIAKFSVGELDPNSDADWEKYLKEYEVMGLPRFLELSQEAYDSMKG